MLESIIFSIIVGGAILYCGISLKKVVTGEKQSHCSSNGCSGCSCQEGSVAKK